MYLEGTMVGRRAKGGKVTVTLIPRKSQNFYSAKRAVEIPGIGQPGTRKTDVGTDNARS